MTMQWQCRAKPMPRDLSHLLWKLHSGHHIICKCHDSCQNTEKCLQETKSNMHHFYQPRFTFKLEIKSLRVQCERPRCGFGHKGSWKVKYGLSSFLIWGATRQSQISRQRILLRDYFALMSMSAAESSRFTYSDLTLSTSASMSVTSHIMTILKLHQ